MLNSDSRAISAAAHGPVTYTQAMTVSAGWYGVGGLAAAIIGAALTTGTAVAWADDGSGHDAAGSPAASAASAAAHAGSDSSAPPTGRPARSAPPRSSGTRSPARTKPAASSAGERSHRTAAPTTGATSSRPRTPSNPVVPKPKSAAKAAAAAPAVTPRATSASATTVAATLPSAATQAAPSAVPAALPNNAAGWFQAVIYNPLHTGIQGWINSPLGQGVDGVINRLAGTYVIGNGRTGTATAPNGTAGGWLFGDGGAGWDSTEAAVRGGNGGAAGMVGNGGRGGSGGAGASGGTGGPGGVLMGIGGHGGAGGAQAGGTGGPGGKGGNGRGLLFGAGGGGGRGGDGADGGRGGNGGSGAFIMGIGGAGGDAGNSGVGGGSTELPALGGAGGNAGLLGNHGAVGKSGTGATLIQTGANTSMLSVTPTGVWLTNSEGQVVLLHGFNEVYKLAPYEPSASGFSEDDAAFLAANGFNVVRLGVIWAGVEPQPGVYDAAYVDSIRQTVDMLAAHGIYTIIDMHQDLYSASLGGEGAPEWATKTGGLPNRSFGFPGSYYLNPAETAAWDGFWNNAEAANGIGLEDNYAKAWETVAAAVAGNNSVIGYDIMNEPFPGTSWLPTLLGSPFYATQQLTPMYNQVAAAIRAVDPNTALFVEPANPAVSEVPAILGLPIQLGTIDDANVVLAFHDYCAGSATSSICGWLAMQQASTAHAYGKANNIPVFMDEFGASHLPSDLRAEMNAADRYLMSWSVWAYSGVGDITTSGSTDGESVVYDPALPPTGDNVNTGNLQVLAGPYPQAVSGTPLKLSNTNGAFTFNYSTTKADGSGNFTAGSLSTLSMPAVTYPNGYTVTVTGGHVASAANAPTLVIASDTDTGVVQVVVTAAP